MGPTFRSIRALETYVTSDTASSCGAQVRTWVDALLVPNVLRSSLPVKRQNLHLPTDRNRRWYITNLRIASLIFELSRNCEGPSIRQQRTAEIRDGTYFQILRDAEFPFKHRHLFFDGGKIKNFRPRITCRSELHSRRGLHDKSDRLVALNARRVHVHVRRKLYFGAQSDAPPRIG